MISKVDMSYYDKRGCLHEIFMEQAQKTPNRTAIVSTNGEKITFEELNFITDILAKRLRSYGVGRNKVVGILMERCAEYTVSCIAILKAGGAYLPIEISYPPVLIKSVLEDARPVVICSKSHLKHLLETNTPIINLENNWLAMLQQQNKNYDSPVPEKISLDDMAYTVYSSGTTGTPKGIQCPHRGAVFSYTWRHLAFPYEEDDREACNIFFVWEMLRPLLKGIPMFIIPDTVIYDPPKLMDFIYKNRITRMLFTPSLIEAVLDTRHLRLTESFKFMRQIWLCGEVVTTTLRNRIASNFPWIKILNLYSITECHDVSCADLTNGEGMEGRTYCPAGKIFPQIHVVIRDENFNEKQIGDAGEILIAGPTLAIGYLNRPDLNKQKFVSIPSWNDKSTVNRWYKTGDWGYLLSDGSLEVIGRCDTMVKIRGYTIELKAVENVLLNLTEISMTCVVTVGTEGTHKILVAYIVPSEFFSGNVTNLIVKLRKLLPSYMIPSQFIVLDKIPILEVSGKINMKELPPVRPFDEDSINVDSKSMNSTEQIIAKIWCTILKVCTLLADDNFFDFGGHSLSAAAAVSRINEVYGTELSTFDLYLNPTVQTLSKLICTGEGATDSMIDLHKELEKYPVPQISTVRLRSFWKSVNLSKDRFRKGNVLLTGVTGFLGSFVLQQLINSTETTVYCIIKESMSRNATERLHSVIQDKNLNLNLMNNSRIIPLSGDIALNKFGLEDVEYSVLCNDIDAVIHCAAHVNLVLPYSALQQTNVTGTHNVVSFCLEGKLKPLHHISTSDVFAKNMKNCDENADMYQHIDQLQHGYAQSKWIAEQIVLSASQNGLPTIISRCGNIGGSQYCTNWNSNDMILLILRGVIRTKIAPTISWQIELTPVDFVSGTIVRLTENVTKTFGKIYHLINSNTIDCMHLWSLLREFGYEIKLASYDKWLQTIKQSEDYTLKPLSILLNSILKNEDYLIKMPNFSQENTKAFLSSSDTHYPSVNHSLMKKYLRKLIAGDYIPAPTVFGENSTSRGITDQNLNIKVALVTGASSGIGRAVAEALAKAGIVTVGAARNLDKLKGFQEELKSKNIRNFIPVQMDVTDKNDVFSCVSNVQANIGPVNYLVNNAGMMEYCKMINSNLDWWLDMVKVNVIGFLNVTACILPHMKKFGGGHIINITSDAGHKSFAGLAVYSGTKFFQEAVSTAMRQEIAEHNIKVSCIAPGDVESGLHDKSRDQEARTEYAYKIKYLDVKEVADTVLFVLNQLPHCAVNSILIEPILGPI